MYLKIGFTQFPIYAIVVPIIAEYGIDVLW